MLPAVSATINGPVDGAATRRMLLKIISARTGWTLERTMLYDSGFDLQQGASY